MTCNIGRKPITINTATAGGKREKFARRINTKGAIIGAFPSDR